jgi:hypothetical protein
MRNKNNTKPNQTARIKILLLVFTVAAVSFAGGYYVAAMQAASMVISKQT